MERRERAPLPRVRFSDRAIQEFLSEGKRIWGIWMSMNLPLELADRDGKVEEFDAKTIGLSVIDALSADSLMKIRKNVAEMQKNFEAEEWLLREKTPLEGNAEITLVPEDDALVVLAGDERAEEIRVNIDTNRYWTIFFTQDRGTLQQHPYIGYKTDYEKKGYPYKIRDLKDVYRKKPHILVDAVRSYVRLHSMHSIFYWINQAATFQEDEFSQVPGMALLRQSSKLTEKDRDKVLQIIRSIQQIVEYNGKDLFGNQLLSNPDSQISYDEILKLRARFPLATSEVQDSEVLDLYLKCFSSADNIAGMLPPKAQRFFKDPYYFSPESNTERRQSLEHDIQELKLEEEEVKRLRKLPLEELVKALQIHSGPEPRGMIKTLSDFEKMLREHSLSLPTFISMVKMKMKLAINQNSPEMIEECITQVCRDNKVRYYPDRILISLFLEDEKTVSEIYQVQVRIKIDTHEQEIQRQTEVKNAVRKHVRFTEEEMEMIQGLAQHFVSIREEDRKYFWGDYQKMFNVIADMVMVYRLTIADIKSEIFCKTMKVAWPEMPNEFLKAVQEVAGDTPFPHE